MSNTYLVIDIGGTFTKFGIMNPEGEFLKKGKIPTRKDSTEEFLQMIVDLFEENKDVDGIGISSAGMIDSKTGVMHNGGSLSCIHELPIAAELQERCHVPVTVENDARSAGLAEIWRGSLKDCNSGIAMILGTAVGGAMILDKKIITGSHCMAGEFSYVLTNAEDALQPMNTLAMQGGVPALIRFAAEGSGRFEEELNGEIIFEEALAGNDIMTEAIRRYARGLAVQITNYQFIFDPDRIAIGGGISAQPLLIEMIKEELQKLNKVYPHPVPVPEICSCEFFNDSNLIGALYVLLQKEEG